MKILDLNHQFVVCMLSPCSQRFLLGTGAHFYSLEGNGDHMHRFIGLSGKFDFANIQSLSQFNAIEKI